MFKRISEAEHNAAIAAMEQAHAAYLAKLAGAVNLDTENMSAEQIGEAIFQAVSDQENELTALNDQLTAAQTQAQSNKDALDASLVSLQEKTDEISAITNLFGDAANADDFNLVQAVGDLTPEDPTIADPNQPAGGPVIDEEIKTELDELGGDFAAGKIGVREFMQNVDAVKPGRV